MEAIDLDLEKLAHEPEGSNAKSGVIYVANEQHIIAARSSGRVIESANDASVDGFALSQPLTQFVTTVTDRDNIEAVLEAMFPSVPVGLRFDYLQENESETMIADDNASIIRPVGGEFKLATTSGTTATGRVYNKGLSIFLDHDQGGNLPGVQQRYVARLRSRVLRSDLVASIALLDAAAVAESSTNWGAADANPDGDVRQSLKNAGDLRGVDSNVVVFGNGAWINRALAYEDSTRTNGGAKADYTPEKLAEVLGVDQAINLKARKRTGAATLAGLIESVVYNYFAQSGATPEDSSNVKRFVKVDGGGVMEVFVETQLKRTKITVSYYSNTIITNAVGIRKRVITFS